MSNKDPRHHRLYTYMIGEHLVTSNISPDELHLYFRPAVGSYRTPGAWAKEIGKRIENDESEEYA